jgi:hypothetical protein
MPSGSSLTPGALDRHGDYFVGIGGPDKGLGLKIGLGDEAIDGGLDLDEGVEDAALEALPRSEDGGRATP